MRYGRPKNARGRRVTLIAGTVAFAGVVGITVWRSALVILPGTEDMPEYRQLGFLKGIAILTVLAASAVIGLVVWWLT